MVHAALKAGTSLGDEDFLTELKTLKAKVGIIISDYITWVGICLSDWANDSKSVKYRLNVLLLVDSRDSFASLF